MQTKRKANSVVTHSYTGTILTIHVLGAGDVVFDTEKVSLVNKAQAERHGWIQRLSDAAAISRDPETGLPATAAEKRDAIQRLADHYMSGTMEWSRVAEAGPRGGILFAALCEMYPDREPQAIREWLNERSKKEQAALRATPSIKAIIDRMEAEAGEKANIDTDSLLASL